MNLGAEQRRGRWAARMSVGVDDEMLQREWRREGKEGGRLNKRTGHRGGAVVLCVDVSVYLWRGRVKSL